MTAAVPPAANSLCGAASNFRQMKSEPRETRLTGMPGTDILPLLSRHRFETMLSATTKQDPLFRAGIR